MAATMARCCLQPAAAGLQRAHTEASYSPWLPCRPLSRRACSSASSQLTQTQQTQQHSGRRRWPRRQRLAALSGGSGGGLSADGEDVFQRALKEYDIFIEDSKKTLESGKKSYQDLSDELVKMKEDAIMPRWVISLAVWTLRVSQNTLSINQKKYDALRSRRSEFADALRAVELELEASPPDMKIDETAADWLALTGYTWATQSEGGADVDRDHLLSMLRDAVDKSSGPNNILWVATVSCLLTAGVAGWGASLVGYDAYRLLHEAPSTSDAAAWAAWTAPYVLGTVVTHSLAPAVFNKSIFRPLACDQQTFFRRMPFINYAAAAGVVAFCQCLVYQGLYQDVLNSWLGGVRDPMLVDGASASALALGSLTAGLRLPALLLAPSTAVLTAALESTWCYGALSLRDSSSSFTLGEETLQAKDWMQGPGGSLEPTTINSDERLIICARVALSSAWLALETTVTGNLWLAVGTSTVGLITSVLLSQRTDGSGGTGSTST